MDDARKRLLSLEEKIDHILLHYKHDMTPYSMQLTPYGYQMLPEFKDPNSTDLHLQMQDLMRQSPQYAQNLMSMFYLPKIVGDF